MEMEEIKSREISKNLEWSERKDGNRYRSNADR